MAIEEQHHPFSYWSPLNLAFTMSFSWPNGLEQGWLDLRQKGTQTFFLHTSFFSVTLRNAISKAALTTSSGAGSDVFLLQSLFDREQK